MLQTSNRSQHLGNGAKLKLRQGKSNDQTNSGFLFLLKILAFWKPPLTSGTRATRGSTYEDLSTSWFCRRMTTRKALVSVLCLICILGTCLERAYARHAKKGRVARLHEYAKTDRTVQVISVLSAAARTKCPIYFTYWTRLMNNNM